MSSDETQDPAARIESIRARIDEVDVDLVALLDRRAGLAREIGKAKIGEGRQRFYDASRQKQVIERAMAGSTGEFPREAMRNVFVEIMSGCLSREKPPTVGFLGPEATFSHLASVSEFGNSAEHKPLPSVLDIFVAVEREWVDYGVVPVENSTGGVIHTTLDMFIDFDLTICSEIFLPIHHHLISRNPIERIKTIYSKAEPFQQCQTWLRENLPGVQLIEVGATTKGVEMARGRDFAAAIGSALAARAYSVPIAAANIEDMKDNTTRFLVVGKQQSAPTGKDKTSVMLSITDRPGALFELLKPFHDRGINLTKIESRPTRRRAWDLVFFIDMEGHMSMPAIGAALEDCRPHTKSMKILGSYPCDVKQRDERTLVEGMTAGPIGDLD